MRIGSRVTEEVTRHGEGRSSPEVDRRDDVELTAIALLCWLFASPPEQSTSAPTRAVSK